MQIKTTIDIVFHMLQLIETLKLDNIKYCHYHK